MKNGVWLDKDDKPMAGSSDAKHAYRTICETILEFGEPDRIGGRKGYFTAVVRRDMLMQVDCGDLVADNIEW